ncbi:GGDEF domain-containing protein [bacterium]|nr:GGDEF domain-containing protein [bacterium]MBU1994156.1 GGDEF domain-containing protein [bacterium]
MSAIMKTFLHSGYTFTEAENDVKYKIIFLNSVVGFAALIAFIMGIIRLNSSYILMGFIDIIFSIVFLFFLFQLRTSKDKIDFISNALIFTAYLLFTAIYLLADNQSSRFSVYYLLLTSAFFLKGRKVGFYWLLVIILTIVTIHLANFLNISYTHLDIFSTSIYLIALYFIMNIYEEIKESQNKTLLALNTTLDSTVKQRTQELERANVELKKEKEKFEILSQTDQLTGLHNRHHIKDIFNFEATQAKRYKTDISIIMMDIDFFKDINDSYGHNAGDQFLKEIAHILKTTLRESELIIRWGGEEFLIIVPKANLSKAKEIAERLRTKIEQHFFINIEKRTASFGIADYKEDESFDALLVRADHALYDAKENGRNCVKTR